MHNENAEAPTAPTAGAQNVKETPTDFKYCTTESPPIASYLLHGAENATTLSELEVLTGERNRTIRLQIERERRAGTPILSDCTEECKGYYLPGNDEELSRFVSGMRRRANEILQTAAAVEATAGRSADG